MSIPTRADRIPTEVLSRAASPVFVRRLAQELTAHKDIPHEDLLTDRMGVIGHVVGVLTDEIAHSFATRIALFASVMLPVEAEQSDCVTWPRDWWQAFRARWLPAWWKRRHPVLYQTRRLVAHIDMRDVLKACLDRPAGEERDDTVIVAPRAEFWS